MGCVRCSPLLVHGDAGFSDCVSRFSVTALAAWALAAMTGLQPNAKWKPSYAATADAIAKVATEAPLYRGAQKEVRTAALFVAISYYESRFRTDARGGKGRWLCLMQVARENLPRGGAAQVLSSPEACLRAALPVLRRSFEKCAGRPEVDRLGAFAASTCEKGAAASRGRSYLAKLLLRRHVDIIPPDPPDPEPEAAMRL